MIKVFYDGCIFYKQRHGGINNVFLEIFKRVSNYSDFECAVTLPSNNKCNNIHRIKKFIVPKIRPNRCFPHFWRILNEIYLKMFRPNIFHSTYYTEHILDNKIKKVLTIHDMIFEIYRRDFNTEKNKRFVQLKKNLAYKADAIVCVSESTKQDVVKYYNINSSKIFVIYNSFNEFFKEVFVEQEKGYITKKYNLFNPYILYVGSTKSEYKNFDLLLTVYTSSHKIHSNIDLIVISPDTYTSEQIDKISKSDFRIRKFSDLTVHDLKVFYSQADMFVYPSKYEGFGIPVLEAMACGTPVLASMASSIPEVGGDSTLYFNPDSCEELEDKIIQIMSDEQLKTTLINKGYENINRFSWDQSVNKLLQVYKNLI